MLPSKIMCLPMLPFAFDTETVYLNIPLVVAKYGRHTIKHYVARTCLDGESIYANAREHGATTPNAQEIDCSL